MELSTGIDDLDCLEDAIKNILANGVKLKKGVPIPGGATKRVLNEVFKLTK
jgi:hypothetical protein